MAREMYLKTPDDEQLFAVSTEADELFFVAPIKMVQRLLHLHDDAVHRVLSAEGNAVKLFNTKPYGTVEVAWATEMWQVFGEIG